MENWERFENDCVEYLQKKYGYGNLKFEQTGKSDSTVSDIAVLDDGNLKFFIEVKMADAQSGQFVLLDESRRFVFSNQNKSSENEISEYILKHINDNYEHYKNVSTASTKIDLSPEIFATWIINHYLENGAKFIITSDYSNSFIIFPTEKFYEYFEISASFRKKKSGSRDLPAIQKSEIQELIISKYGRCEIVYEGKKAYAIVNETIPDKEKLTGMKYSYQLNCESNGKYLIRVLSNTNNANVIFSIRLKQKQEQSDVYSFEHEIGAAK
ncbi:MAG TPA: hypothetical protein DIC60_09705 [Lachnospiraceae bacterium]|nr:hypothetical protein [Lachnospiraceae bacterium]